MTTPQIQATIETVARQAGIPEDQRRSWVAGTKWGLAQRYAQAPQPRLPPEAVMGGVEWTAPGRSVPENVRFDRDTDEE